MANQDNSERPQAPAGNDQERLAAMRAALPLENSTVEALFEYVRAQVSAEGCDHTREHTAAFLQQHSLPERPVLRWFNNTNGFCDCEILLNSEAAWAECKHVDAALANAGSRVPLLDDDAALVRAAANFRYAREFDQLFPEAEHKIVESERPFGPPDGWMSAVAEWRSRASLYGRYVVRIRTAVDVAADGAVSPLESPHLDVIEVIRVDRGKDEEDGPKYELQLYQFAEGAWAVLYESSGDFSALEFDVKTDAPTRRFHVYFRDTQ